MAADTFGRRPTTLVVSNVKKIRGLNLPGTPLGHLGLLRDDLYLYLYIQNYMLWLIVKTDNASFRGWVS